MKLRDKDTKKYLLTVFVATFVAYIIPAVVLYLGHFMGIMLTICISLFNLSMALLAWLWAKSVRKEFLLKKSCCISFSSKGFKVITFHRIFEGGQVEDKTIIFLPATASEEDGRGVSTVQRVKRLIKVQSQQ